MATFKLNTSGNDLDMELITKEKRTKLDKQSKLVSAKLSPNILSKMKQIAMIKNPTSDNAILHAYLTTTLNDYDA